MKSYYFLAILLSIMSVGTIFGAPKGNLFVSVTCEKQNYNIDQPIAVALTVLNKNNTPFKANFTSSQRYDFCLYREKELVWKWSRDMMFAQALSSMVLQPKKPITYVVVFNQVLPSGKLLEPGKYNLIGSFVTKETSYSSEPVEITIH